MSVIGRLDDQVEAVLINPLKRERTPGVEARERPARPALAARDAESSPEPDAESSPERGAELSPERGAESLSERDAESSPERRESAGALPVWML